MRAPQYPIGAVFTNNGRHYVLLDDGLAAIGELAAELIGTEQVAISTSAVGDNSTDATVEPKGFPAERPEVVAGLGGYCAILRAEPSTGAPDRRAEAARSLF